MRERTSMEIEVRTQTYIADGVRLEIVAAKIAENKWSLSVINQQCIRSIWSEFFESPDLAFAAARRAIQKEGMEEFTSLEGFEYLNEIENDL